MQESIQPCCTAQKQTAVGRSVECCIAEVLYKSMSMWLCVWGFLMNLIYVFVLGEIPNFFLHKISKLQSTVYSVIPFKKK